jgi:hypothetical protein
MGVGIVTLFSVSVCNVRMGSTEDCWVCAADAARERRVTHSMNETQDTKGAEVGKAITKGVVLGWIWSRELVRRLL